MGSIINGNGTGNSEGGLVDACSGMLRLQAELTDKIEPRDAESLSHLCLTLENGHVQGGTLREEIEQRYGSIGLEVLAAAENPSQHYFSQKGFVITNYPEYIECLYGSMTTANLVILKAALGWLVMHRRTPVANQMSVSWGAWAKDIFILLPLIPVEWPRSCWWKMFDSGIVASFVQLDDCESFHDCSDDDGDDLDISELYDDLNSLIPERPLLKMRPDVMSLLAGVSRPVQVGQGYILCGPYSAMVPITRQYDGSIRWHYERKEAQDSELAINELESIRSEWYETFDLDFLINAPAHIGWSREDKLLLGTTHHAHNTTWAPKAEKPEAPYSFSLNASRHYRYFGIIKNPHYVATLQNFQYCPWILYVSAKRAWLVPATKVLLYMVLMSTKTFGTQQFPLAASCDGVLDVLLNKNHLIQLSSRGQATLGDLVTGLITDMDKITPISIGRGWIAGYQLMDFTYPPKGSVSGPVWFRLRPSPRWDTLLEGIPCLIGADMEEVIVSGRPRDTNPLCHRLFTGQNFFAATISTMNDITRVVRVVAVLQTAAVENSRRRPEWFRRYLLKLLF